jgi:hypothetical protein
LNLEVYALAIDPANPTTLFAGVYGGGVFKFSVSSGTWTPSNAGLTNLMVMALAIDPIHPNSLYVGTYNGGVY